MSKLQNNDGSPFIYPKELAEKVRRSVRWAQNTFQQIRYLLQKKRYQPLTVEEVSSYLCIPPESIRIF